MISAVKIHEKKFERLGEKDLSPIYIHSLIPLKRVGEYSEQYGDKMITSVYYLGVNTVGRKPFLFTYITGENLSSKYRCRHFYVSHSLHELDTVPADNLVLVEDDED